ncbi:aminotransferase class V-fold PLP-dependent enzyme [Janibacter terrae]|uniref:Kynureninase n=1 Tax=Janibacter terrae TaxID=103817 RepID=A0ABZ2FDA3_9MICO|nr:kynureninase [Kytococcus sp.]
MSASALRDRAAALDAADPLRHCRDLYLPSAGLVAYLDGNSLGRPLRATAERITHLVEHEWADRLIRSWDERWMELPLRLGDRIGEVCLGAAPGQTVVGDSTTVMLYKLLRAAVAAAGPDRPEIVLDSENFPTDRYVAQGIAAETGARLVWLEPDPAKGVTPDLVAGALTERTGVVLLSHVAYKSAWVADLPAITALAHDAGALVLWDLCHSVGVLPCDLDAQGVDLAVGCTYKFLGGGPGAPAFGYVAARHQRTLRQPIQGWMGHAEPFVMGPGYEAGAGMRGFISGTPPVLGMVGIEDTVDLIASVGLDAVRDKATRLGRFVIDAVDDTLAEHGVRVVSPREDADRGGHVTIGHPRFREVYRELWAADVVPDFREPDGIRLGLSPLSTSYGEVAEALLRIGEALSR